MDVEDVLKRAASAVEAAGIPEELRVAAFEKAVDLYSGSAAAQPQPTVAVPEPVNPQPAGPLARIAGRLGISPEAVADVYFVDGEELGIGVASSSIDSRKAGGTKELALLVAGGWQLAGLEEWTSLERVRAISTEYGRYDDSNFSATIQELGDYFQIRGSRRNREVRLKRPGVEAVSRLVRRLAGLDR